MKYLTLKNVSFSYDKIHKAVDGVSLDFSLGESVAIIGQNGAGKTTTVKMMNGLIRPNTGKIFINGKDTSSESVADLSHHVGYVFQNPDEQIFQDSVRKEIEFSLKRKNIAESEITKRVNDAAKLCELTDKLDEHPYDLPYSQRKFVTIASIIAMNPEIMIFDEPTAGQDHHSILLLERIIKTLQKQNKLVITITHDMTFVANNFKRVIVFAKAHKQKDGTPNEIFSDTALLTMSKLEPPMIGKLAQKLGFKNIFTIDKLLETYND